MIMNKLYSDADIIVRRAIEANMPQAAVRNALEGRVFTKNLYLVAIGKAAWNMANAACTALGSQIKKGIVITKYEHCLGEIPNMEIIEAGHPLSDDNTILGTQKAIELAKSLTAEDELLFLISGGGSALFEAPLPGISLEDIVDINSQLLACGADIVEINMIRKRLSGVKAGRFAGLAKPASVFTVVLSDVLGDRLDSIASGPAFPDMSTTEDAQAVIDKYGLKLTAAMKTQLKQETPKKVDNVESVITGSVRTLCNDTAKIAAELGYTPHILCSGMNCEAREAGRLMASVARQVGDGGSCGEGDGGYSFKRPCAIILGGETVVHLKGKGKGGRNQELALAAAEGIAGMRDTLLFSFGSDGTDGPTDAAGGMVDGNTMAQLKAKGLNVNKILDDNDAYHGLKAIDRLIMTGPTGTNVNDVAVILCK